MVLYIIGNGFDIEHGINSSYSDFKKFLSDKEGFARKCYIKNRRAYYKLMNTDSDVIERDIILCEHINKYLYGDNPYENWSDLEKRTEILSDMYFNHPEYISDPERDGDRLFNGKYVNISSEHARQLYNDFNWISDFQPAFSEWVEYINMAKTHRQLQIDSTDSVVLSFNYNDMIQKTYQIPELMVQCIHRQNIGGEYSYIFGHNLKPIEPDKSNDEKELSYVITIQMSLYKNCKLRFILIDELLTEKTIDRVVVFGCSYNDIDFPYFKRVKRCVNDNCPWDLYYHVDSDKIRAENYKRDLHIKNYNIMHTSVFPRC